MKHTICMLLALASVSGIPSFAQQDDWNSDSRFASAGQVTLTRIDRNAAYVAGEDYRGAMFGKPAVQTATRHVMFLVAQREAVAKDEITTESTVGIQNLPEVFQDAQQAAWQPVAQDDACEPSSSREPHHDTICTATMVDPEYRNAAEQMEDVFRGYGSPAPSGHLMRLVMRIVRTWQGLG